MSTRRYTDTEETLNDVIEQAKKVAQRHDVETLRLIRDRLALGRKVNEIPEDYPHQRFEIKTGFGKDLETLWAFLKESARLPEQFQASQSQDMLHRLLAHLITGMKAVGKEMHIREETLICMPLTSFGWDHDAVTKPQIRLAAEAYDLEQCDPDVVVMGILNNVPHDATFLTGELGHLMVLRSERGSLITEHPTLWTSQANETHDVNKMWIFQKKK